MTTLAGWLLDTNMSLPNLNKNIGVKNSANKPEHLGETKNCMDNKSDSSSDVQMGVMVTKHDLLSVDLANGTANNSNVSTTYFGVHIPSENIDKCDLFANVFTDKLEAVKALKKHKKARLKVFNSREDAVDFVMNGVGQMPLQELACSQAVGEKPTIFKGPKSQDLVRLRKLIESGDLATVQAMIWENPRYLVSVGDTPSILQEGSRYNALHVATKAKAAQMTEMLIHTVRDPAFVGLLYGDDNEASCGEKARMLLDLYLNTPDKGLNETPLHFAVKFGAREVVEVLVACPQCDRHSKNKFGQTPKDIICSRDNDASAKVKEEISKLLDDQFYVPVLRSEDNSLQPTIGLPFSPVRPLVLNTSLMDARMQIQAFAGPMNEQQAVMFRKKWKTPPRSNPNSPAARTNRRLQDPEKGLESEGRHLAAEHGYDWKEYWPFMDTFTDLTSAEGLGKLEDFLKRKYAEEAMKGSPKPVQEADDTVVPEPAFEPLSPISDLCCSLQACSLLDRSREAKKHDGAKNVPVRSLSSCFKSAREEEALLNMIANPGLSPFLCVEKSCQVYGKRIADGLHHLAASDLLKQEVKHLQTLICSYMDDPRFVSVDFHLVHSRIASIVHDRIGRLPADESDLIARFCAEETADGPTAAHGSSDEDELNVPTETYRSQTNTTRISKRDATMFSDHVKCIVQHIRNGINYCGDKHLKNASAIVTEEECMNVWSDAVKCSCRWQTQCFLRNSRKGSSYKRLKHATNLDAMDNGRTDGIARQLHYEPARDEILTLPDSGDVDLHECEEMEVSDSENEGDFFTPPSSLHGGDSSQDEGMSSAEEDEEVYIEGSVATSTDLAVLHAIEKCRISAMDHPYVYRWRHMMMLRPARERVSARQTVRTPCKADSAQQPTESWHRVLDPSSPASPQFKEDRFKYRKVPFF